STDWPKFHFDLANSGLDPYEKLIGPGNVSQLGRAWTGPPVAPNVVSSPAVVGGVVYVGGEDGVLYAFSASGTTNCSGAPKTCTPLWTAATGSSFELSPAVANGVVYAGSNTATNGKLYAFSASGTTNCSGTPKTCTPLWTGATMGIIGSPA